MADASPSARQTTDDAAPPTTGTAYSVPSGVIARVSSWEKPYSNSAMWSFQSSGALSVTQISCAPPRSADETRQRPAFFVKPVLMPVQSEYSCRSRLWLSYRTVFSGDRNSTVCETAPTVSAKSAQRMASAPSSAISYAVVPCPSASSPEGVTNRVFSMPISAARAFISDAKPSALPPRNRAIAFAPSLPEAIIMPRAMLPSVSRSPAASPIEEPSTATISAVTSTTASACPLSKASSAVMIFVVLAIGSTSPPFFSYSTVPLSGSYSTAACAETDGASAADAGSATSSAANTAAAAAKIFLNKRITCHSPFYGGRRRFMPVSTAAAARRLPLPYPF